MKRATWLLMILACLLAPLAAQTVTVTSPNGGEEWQLGTPHAITWNSQNAGATKVNLILRKDGGVVGTIKSNVALSAGSWAWASAGTLEDGTKVAAGSGYIVRIRDAGNTFGDNSNAGFSLAAGGPPVLQLTAPNGGETWAAGGEQLISWTANWSGTLQLNLYQDGNFIGIINGGVNSTQGSFPWKVGRLQDNKTSGFGGGFKVRAVRSYPGATAPAKALMDESDGAFHIRVGQEASTGQLPVVHLLHVIEPIPGHLVFYGDHGYPVENGGSFGVSWEIACPGNFRIILCDDKGNQIRELTDSAYGNGKTVTIKPDFAPAGREYRVLVQSLDGSYSGLSAKFRVEIKNYSGPLKADMRVCKYAPTIIPTKGTMPVKAQLRILVVNEGWADSKPCYLRYEVSNGPAGSIQIFAEKPQGGGMHDIDGVFKGGGPWHYTIEIDSMHEVDELNEDNNVISGFIPCHEPQEVNTCGSIAD